MINKKLIFFFFIAFTVGCSKKEVAILPLTKLSLGQSYNGGIIFYLDDSGKHGLVAASKDVEYNPKGELTVFGMRTTWGCEDIITGANGTAIGTGKSNTQKITALPCGMNNTPASICDNLVLEGFTDWFLPSKDELARIYDVLYLKNLGGFVEGNEYWSSTEKDTNASGLIFNGYRYQFADGKYGYNVKIRPVRSF